MKVKLGEVFTILSGGTPDTKKSEYYENGNIPWIKTGDLKGKYISTEVDLITEKGLHNSSAKLFPSQTVLVAMYGATIGACSILPYEASTNQACAAFLPSTKVLPEYLYYFLCSHKEQFVRDGVGGAQPNISAGYLKAVDLDVPSLDVQQEAVFVLNKVDNVIINRKQQLHKLDELVKARFVEMFGTIHNNVFRFAEGTLESISDEFFAGGDKPEDCTTERDEAHPYPVFANGYENEGLQGYSAKCRVTQPAVTVSARGTIGYCFIREAGFTPVVRLVTIVPNNKVSPVFLKYAIDTMDIKSSGTSQAQLTVPDFKRERIIVPPVELQGQFAAFVSQVDKSKLSIQASLDQLETLKQSLMQVYFG